MKKFQLINEDRQIAISLSKKEIRDLYNELASHIAQQQATGATPKEQTISKFPTEKKYMRWAKQFLITDLTKQRIYKWFRRQLPVA